MNYILSVVLPAGNESSIATLWEFAGECWLLIMSASAAFGLFDASKELSKARMERSMVILCAVLGMLVVIGVVDELISHG
jgi:hypothetical protein